MSDLLLTLYKPQVAGALTSNQVLRAHPMEREAEQIEANSKYINATVERNWKANLDNADERSLQFALRNETFNLLLLQQQNGLSKGGSCTNLVLTA